MFDVSQDIVSEVHIDFWVPKVFSKLIDGVSIEQAIDNHMINGLTDFMEVTVFEEFVPCGENIE
jgi:hypothetical protein